MKPLAQGHRHNKQVEYYIFERSSDLEAYESSAFLFNNSSSDEVYVLFRFTTLLDLDLRRDVVKTHNRNALTRVILSFEFQIFSILAECRKSRAPQTYLPRIIVMDMMNKLSFLRKRTSQRSTERMSRRPATS